MLTLVSTALLSTACQKEAPKTSDKLLNKNLKVKTLNGTETDTKNIFLQAELTVINIWNPSCSTCEDEMKILGTLNQEYAGMGVQMIGIIKDVSKENDSASLAITENSNSGYMQILDSADLTAQFWNDSYDIPTTLYISRDGKLLGKAKEENKDIDKWRNEIETYHQQVCTNDHPAECSTG